MEILSYYPSNGEDPDEMPLIIVCSNFDDLLMVNFFTYFFLQKEYIRSIEEENEKFSKELKKLRQQRRQSM